MPIETFRKKLHSPTADDEEWVPKRKIKRRAHVYRNPHMQQVMNNPTLVAKILGFAVNDGSVLNHLVYRQVNRAFDIACLHHIRQELRHLQIDSIGRKKKRKTNNIVVIHDIPMNLEKIGKFFELLRRAKCRIESMEFAGFIEWNELVHNCVLHEIFSFGAVHIRNYQGADEICENGCSLCYSLATNAAAYGPMQVQVLLKGFPEPRHFQYLLITEVFLTEFAMYCLDMVASKFEALERMESIIGRNITCDVLEIVISDQLMFSNSSSNLPRDIIDCILKQWKPKSVKIKFLTGYSSVDCKAWQQKNVFEPIRFDAKTVRKTNMLHSERFSSLELDMKDGRAFAEMILDENYMSGGLNGTWPDMIFVNSKKVFPSDLVFITLPVAIHDFVRERFEEFCQKLLVCIWNDDSVNRNSKYFVRTYCYGITPEQIQESIQTCYIFNGRQILSLVPQTNFEVLQTFDKWLPDARMCKFSPMTYLSFEDILNKCQIHLEVCGENGL